MSPPINFSILLIKSQKRNLSWEELAFLFPIHRQTISHIHGGGWRLRRKQSKLSSFRRFFLSFDFLRFPKRLFALRAGGMLSIAGLTSPLLLPRTTRLMKEEAPALTTKNVK